MPTLNINSLDSEWLSVYIDFDGNIYSTECDEILARFVAPCIALCKENNWVTQYFFLRYRDTRPHIRLRLYGNSDLLSEHVRPLLELKGPDSWSQGKSSLRLRYVPYEPEVSRYGGRQGVRLAEQFFSYSSQASLSIIGDHFPMDNSSRLGMALLAMIVLLFIFLEERERVARFVLQYGVNYLKNLVRDEEFQSSWFEAFQKGHAKQSDNLTMYITTVWERLLANESLSDTFDRYKSNVQEIQQQFRLLLERQELFKTDAIPFDNLDQAVSMIVPSYMHMMNNRLGVTVHEESYLSYLIYRALIPEHQLIYSLSELSNGRS